MNFKQKKLEELVREKLHDLLRKYGVCNNTDYFKIINGLDEILSQSIDEAYEEGKKENIMAINSEVAENFDKDLKDNTSELVKIIRDEAVYKTKKEIKEKLNKGVLTAGLCAANEKEYVKFLFDIINSIV